MGGTDRPGLQEVQVQEAIIISNYVYYIENSGRFSTDEKEHSRTPYKRAELGHIGVDH